MFVSSQLLSGLLHLILIVPFIFLSRRKWTKEDRRMMAVFFILFLLWTVLTTGFTNVRLFEGQLWNWTGKVMGLLMSFFFIYRARVLNSRETGMRITINEGSFLPVLVLFLTGLLVRAAILFILQNPSPVFNTETVLFQSTANAIGDEIFFRGILLGLLSKLYPAGEDLFGFKLSWNILITALLFGLTQGLIFQNGFHLQINLMSILMGFLCGLIAGMLKERSGNIIPAILFHALWFLATNH